MKLESTVKVVARGPAGITARLDGDTLSVGGTVVSGSSSATSLVSLEGARLFGAVALAAFAERGLSAAQGFRMPQNGEVAGRAVLVKL